MIEWTICDGKHRIRGKCKPEGLASALMDMVLVVRRGGAEKLMRFALDFDAENPVEPGDESFFVESVPPDDQW